MLPDTNLFKTLPQHLPLGDMAEEQQKRQTARRLWIATLLAGAYVKEEGMRPNHVLLPDASSAARVNLVGIVVSTSSDGLPTLVIDDGTGRISVRAFEASTQMSQVSVGDAVAVIGRPRQFGNEMYVLPEIVRKLPDLGWLEVRKAELAGVQLPAQGSRPAAQEQVQTQEEDVVDDSFSLAENVLGAIRSLDSGPGADTEAVIEHIGARDAEKTIQFLLRNGDIFEVRPGKLKVLE
jgi:hypothetical protein